VDYFSENPKPNEQEEEAALEEEKYDVVDDIPKPDDSAS
jgi:hypothetical protein